MADEPRSAAPEEKPPKKRKKKLLVIAGASLVLLGGAGVVLFTGGAEAPEGGSEAAVEEGGEPAGITLDPFVVNLADLQSERYLRVAIQVVLDRPEVAEAADAEGLAVARLRDRLLTLLSSKTADDLATFEGKEALRGEVRRTAEQLFVEARVLDVYFTEFLVQ